MGLRVILLLLLTASLFAGANAMAKTGPKKGQSAPEFELNNMDGEPVTLTELRKKGHVLVVFWSTQCHVCHAMLPLFKQIHADYVDRPVTLVAINVGWEDHNSVETYVFEHDVPYLVLNQDEKKAEVARDYQLRGTPTIELIDPQGQVVFRGHRIPDLDHYLRQEVADLDVAPEH